MSEPNLIPDQRRERLMRLLREHVVLSVAQLTAELGVSHMTVRRDISELEREGRAHSVAGGVRLASVVHDEPTFDLKAVRERPEKAAIARIAAQEIDHGMTVYLDAGTTTGALIPVLLERRNITVITNDFEIVARLTGTPQVRVIHTGGRLEHENRSAVGRVAAEMLRAINTDVAFMSTNSWDSHRGVTTPSEEKVDLKRAAMNGAQRTVLLVTSSKFGTIGLYDVAPLKSYDRIVTDDALPGAAARGIRDMGIVLDLATTTRVSTHEPDESGDGASGRE